MAGRLVWEAYEADLKFWERENPRPVEEESSIVGGDRKEESEGGRKRCRKTDADKRRRCIPIEYLTFFRPTIFMI